MLEIQKKEVKSENRTFRIEVHTLNYRDIAVTLTITHMVCPGRCHYGENYRFMRSQYVITCVYYIAYQYLIWVMFITNK